MLEWLLKERIFNCVEPNVPNVVEEFCMAHCAAIGQRLLVRIEGLERRVHLPQVLFNLFDLTGCF